MPMDRAAGSWMAHDRAQRRTLQDLLRAITESRANYHASYVIDLACPLVLGYFGWRQATDWPVALASLCTGVVVFSFVEYAIHRWLFHARDGVMVAMHHAHHEDPHGHSALPCVTSAVVAVVSWSVLAAIVGQQIACFFLCGLLSGYFSYASLHHLEHRVRISAVPLRWLQRRWAAHSVHHRLVDANFGVTTSFWDHVFRTDYRSRSRHERQAAAFGRVRRSSR